MTRKEPVKNHIRSGNPSRGQASRAAHTASKGTKTTSMPSDRTVSARRKAQNTRMKRMRRKRIRNTIFLLLLLIVLLLFLITFECIRMSLRAKDLAGKIICCGVGSIVSIQSFINICVATGLAPNTGTPLPFVSYGLTSLISLFMGMGLVLNVGLQSSAYNKELQKKGQKSDTYFRKEEYL